MFRLPLGLAFLLLQSLEAKARTQYAPEDTYAFPKYHINFLNNHPISAAHAQMVLNRGLTEGIQDFMGNYHSMYEGDWPTLDGPENAPLPQLKQMRLGGDRSFLCLTPPPLTFTPPPPEEPAPVDPAKSWALLQPLKDTCLYHRQGWFTYSYCHNKQVRQFKELEHSHPHPPGGRIPKEDPEYHAYTLGKSTEGAVAAVQGEGGPTGLQLSEGAGKRYLTSKWTDGTPCDKTGRGREIEIQFHCSMTTTDSIQFLKETSVCKYLLVIHTPRLCGEPGFQSLREKQRAAPIHCREILAPDVTKPDGPKDEVTGFEFFPEGPQPVNSRTRDPSHLPNLAEQRAKQAKAKTLGGQQVAGLGGKAPPQDAFTQAIEALLKKRVKNTADAGAGAGAGAGAVGQDAAGGAEGAMLEFMLPLDGGGEEEVLVQVLDLEGLGGEGAGGQDDLMNMLRDALGAKLAQALTKKKQDGEQWEDEEQEQDQVYADDSL